MARESGETRVADSTGTLIDPATEIKQDEIIANQTDGTQTTQIKGLDTAGTAQSVGVVGKDPYALSTEDTQSHLLKEILVELKIINKHLELLTEAEFKGVEIER